MACATAPTHASMADSNDKRALEADITAEVDEVLGSVERCDESPPHSQGTPDAAALAAEVESLRAQVEASTAKGREALEKLEKEHDRLLRAAADLENTRKRAAREREEIQRFGIEKVLKDLLPVVDGLDRALAAATPSDPLAEGVRLVRASLEQTLARHGVAGFSALGERFDPAVHEALMQVPTAEKPPGTVVLEHARGFKLHERLLRPAMVGVAVAPSVETEQSPPDR